MQHPSELTNANFRFLREPSRIWICGGFVLGADDEVRQVELYRVALLVQIIRFAVGPAWVPHELQLQSPDGRHIHETVFFKHTNIAFGCREPAVAIPYKWLFLPLSHLPKSQRDTGAQVAPLPEDGLGNTFDASVKEVVRTHILSGQLDIAGVASHLDMPIRTLQRRLAETGTSFSQIVDAVRTDAALTMLQDGGVKISDVANEVGYKNPAHFTRAFARMTGTTPSEFRRIHLVAN